jgi:hypothetical protein
MPIGHPVFWLAAGSPFWRLLLVHRFRSGSKVPVVVLEVVLGIVIGPHVPRLRFEGILSRCSGSAWRPRLHGGIEPDFSAMEGATRSSLALGGWGASSLLLAWLRSRLLRNRSGVDAPMMVVPRRQHDRAGRAAAALRDGGRLTRLRRMVLAVGTSAKWRDRAMALLLSRRYSTWQDSIPDRVRLHPRRGHRC